MNSAAASSPESAGGFDIFIIAGEASGDELGAHLIDSIRARLPGVNFRGIGGDAMRSRSFQSLFPMHDIAVMGFAPVVANLPRLLNRIKVASQSVLNNPPAAMVIIDSPDFTHRVARKVRAGNSTIPIINYVSPSVWAWRPGRARRMLSYVDHVLALLPFEPDALSRLGGPPCTYVGHPLLQRLDELRPGNNSRSRQSPTLVILPGSRRSEIQKLMPVFGETVDLLAASNPGLNCILPAAPGHLEEIQLLLKNWSIQPQIVTGESEKFAAFHQASAAIAASGTVSLELALAQTPMVIAYKVSPVEAAIAARLLRTKYVGLPNIILDELLVPEYLQNAANPGALAAALQPLLIDGPDRQRQLDGFVRIEQIMRIAKNNTPSGVAADIVVNYVRQGRTVAR